jgi:hypothetical protein
MLMKSNSEERVFKIFLSGKEEFSTEGTHGLVRFLKTPFFSKLRNVAEAVKVFINLREFFFGKKRIIRFFLTKADCPTP